MPLWERIEQTTSLASPSAEDLSQTEAILQRWCKSAGLDDWAVLEKRLRWDGWEMDRIRAVLATPPRVDTAALPPWTALIEELMTTARAMSVTPSLVDAVAARCIKSDRPVPYEDVLLPAVAVARQHLRQPIGTGDGDFPGLTSAAHGQLERGLI
ncbi:MAG: hypothetical protein WCP34_11285, partial [Pseudomonadota bacterium]